jgi:hypothetical protein
MTLPRRIQLVKLLRQNGLRDVERMREDELKEALKKLRVVVPDPATSTGQHPSSGAFIARPAELPPPIDDEDDAWALPRFREPRLLLPDEERTFLRAIAVKPRLLFVTWDVRRDQRHDLEGPVELHLFWRDFLGDAPSSDDLLAQPPALRLAVELSSNGWYVNVPGERLAVAAALVVATSGRRIAQSNTTLTPPARPAPPGPWWVATLPPSLDRRRLRNRALFKGELLEADLRRIGESDARGLDLLEDESPPASGSKARLPWMHVPAPSSATSSGGWSGGKT